jgi:MbtH protein
MSNPFEDENGQFHVLINEEGQYSIWPTFINVPYGWVEIYRFQSRRDCLEYVNKHWTDMRPSSLVEKNGELTVK